ncbi:MAG: divergent PAP2 family protein [Candidatus Omnitrophota bacterium]|nr:MAG: divergent PAP2 family protein [Candidatus Omnitrophota bacterium]
MINFFRQVFQNEVFVTVLVAWFIAQSAKVFLGVITEKRFNFRWFVDTGGMPSSHAATVSALAGAIGLRFGVTSPVFAVTLVFAWIIMMDAQGFRRSVGEQAEILNMILDDIYWKKKLKEESLREFLGHTPIEVFIGAIIGILVAIIFI